MKLVKRLFEAGVFDGAELSASLRDEILSVTIPSPTQVPEPDTTLRVLNTPAGFVVWDFDGILLTTRSAELLIVLLLLKSPRELLFGKAEKPKSSVDEGMIESIRKRAIALRDKMNEDGIVRGKAGGGTELGEVDPKKPVKQVGVGDGPPIFPTGD